MKLPLIGSIVLTLLTGFIPAKSTCICHHDSKGFPMAWLEKRVIENGGGTEIFYVGFVIDYIAILAVFSFIWFLTKKHIKKEKEV